jgi:catechol 2,3-dioxygenase
MRSAASGTRDPPRRASDHGEQALPPDQNGLELYRDRAREEWPRDASGGLMMTTQPLDVRALLKEAP